MRPLPLHRYRLRRRIWWLAALSALAIALMHGLSIAHDTSSGAAMTMPAASMPAASVTAASMTAVDAHAAMRLDAATGSEQTDYTPVSSGSETTCAAHDDCQVIGRSEIPLGTPARSAHDFGALLAAATSNHVTAGHVRARAPCLDSLGISRT